MADIWNLSNQPLLELFAGKRDTKAIGFADDTLLLLKGKNLNHLIKRAQTNLNKALRWGNSVGLTFNPLKTAIIFFHHKNLIDEQELTKIKMGDVSVPYVSSTRYLGVIIDSKLSWREHLKDKINDCKKTLMMC